MISTIAISAKKTFLVLLSDDHHLRWFYDGTDLIVVLVFFFRLVFIFFSPEKQAKQKANNGHIRWDQEDGTIIECESFLGS